MTTYEPTIESLRTHAVPDWFHDAKLGIFVHWGLYSVPAWAEQGLSPLERSERDGSDGVSEGFRHNTYAEWYLNSITIDGTEAQRHHNETYGGAPYEDFAPVFRDATAGWDPQQWADLFARAGARYVVMGTKHHDGFLMWPSATPNPFRVGWQSERDLVGELTEAVRGRDMRMGLFYSGGIDWTFQGLPITDWQSMIRAIPQRDDYAAYADAHWRELIERYQPAVLWNDIHYPTAADAPRLMADYYNAIPDGVVNNRFDVPGVVAGTAHADYITPEYAAMEDINPTKWETCRGIGQSFGYNRNETDADRLSGDGVVHLLVDVVSKNGNLLLNVGPAGDGTIPFAQAERLLVLGWWLRANGDAIYGTRPWTRASGRTADGADVRFTTKDGDLFAIVLGTPTGREVVLEDVHCVDGAAVQRLGHSAPLTWTQKGGDLLVRLPDLLSPSPAVAFRIGGAA